MVNVKNAKVGAYILFDWSPVQKDKLKPNLSKDFFGSLMNRIFSKGIKFFQMLEYLRLYKKLDYDKTRWTHVGKITKVTARGVYIGEQLWTAQNAFHSWKTIEEWDKLGIIRIRNPKYKISKEEEYRLFEWYKRRKGSLYDMPTILKQILRISKSYITVFSKFLAAPLKYVGFIETFISRPTEETCICTELTDRNTHYITCGKISIAKEFGLFYNSRPFFDISMPMHFAISKHHKDIK